MPSASFGIIGSKRANLPPGIPTGTKTLTDEFLWTVGDIFPASFSLDTWGNPYPGYGWQISDAAPTIPPVIFSLTPEFNVSGWRPTQILAYASTVADNPCTFYTIIETSNELIFSPVSALGLAAALVAVTSSMSADLIKFYIVCDSDPQTVISSLSLSFIGYTGPDP